MWQDSKARDGRGGFMLAEVLVALMVATILILALTRVLAATRTHMAQIQDRLEIWMVGRTLIDRLPSETSLETGTTTGRIGRFHWRIDVAPLGSSDLSTTVLARSSDSDFIQPNKTSTPSTGSTSSSTLQGTGPVAGQQASGNGTPSSPATKTAQDWITYKIAVRVEDPSGARYASDTIRIGHNASD
jgi:Tfp pilus assembly protein PilV